MEQICELRRVDNLPGMAIQRGTIGEVGYVSDLMEKNPSANFVGVVQQRIKSCLETMNHFMTLPNPIVTTMVSAEKLSIDSDIMTTVAKILGIKDIKKINHTWTLIELGMDSILAVELKQNFSQKDPYHSGHLEFSTFFLEIRKKLRDQLVELKIWLRLAVAMEPLVKNLCIQTLCFQYYLIEEYKSVQALCHYFSSYILEKLRPENEFCLIGYSIGSMFAMEVAEILEKQDRKGRLLLIDGSPAFTHYVHTKRMQDIAVEQKDEFIQNHICRGVITTLLPDLSEENYSKHLENTTDWETKKKVTLSILSKLTKSEITDHQIFDQCFNMYEALEQYEISSGFSLQSPCVLIRCLKTYSDFPLDESYNLTQYFKNPIIIHKIDDVDHDSILSHQKTAEIIINSLSRKEE